MPAAIRARISWPTRQVCDRLHGGPTAKTLSVFCNAKCRGREDGTFSSNDFTFDRERNVYICPANKLLRTTGNAGADHKVRYRASRRDCRACPLKPQCSPNTPSRKITRDVHEDARDHARSFVGTPEFEQSRDERKKVEMRFAHLKTHHRFERMRLRGLSGARDEFHLAAIVQNLKTLAGQLWQPPPDALAASAR